MTRPGLAACMPLVFLTSGRAAICGVVAGASASGRTAGKGGVVVLFSAPIGCSMGSVKIAGEFSSVVAGIAGSLPASEGMSGVAVGISMETTGGDVGKGAGALFEFASA